MISKAEERRLSLLAAKREDRRELTEVGIRLNFNGDLSVDERRMAEQGTFDGPASWESE